MSSLTELAWEVLAPPETGSPGWLDEVEAFRGRVLYDGGRRPAFKADDGRFADPDPADRRAYHVIASGNAGIAGCFRVIPLACTGYGLCDRLLGEAETDRTLCGLGVTRAEATEGGGWAVHPDARGQGLGVRLFATGIALAEQLGYQLMLGASGTRYGQYQTLTKTGVRPVPGVPVLPVPKLADELRVVFAGMDGMEPALRALVDEAAGRL